MPDGNTNPLLELILVYLFPLLARDHEPDAETPLSFCINLCESFSMGLLGIWLLSESALNRKVEELDQEAWNLHFIHSYDPNLLIYLLPILILTVNLGLWTIIRKKRLVFEKHSDL